VVTKKIKKEINALANLFYKMHGCQVENGYDFEEATHPQERSMWNLARASYDFWETRGLTSKSRVRIDP